MLGIAARVTMECGQSMVATPGAVEMNWICRDRRYILVELAIDPRSVMRAGRAECHVSHESSKS